MEGSEGFEEFFRLHFSRLVGALGLYCGDPDLADDAAQEAMVRACTRWSKVSRLDSPESWVFCVGRNILRSHFRRLKMMRRHRERLIGQPADIPSISEKLALEEFVQALPERQRTILILRYYLDLSVLETADALAWPEGTVKTLTRSGIGNLRETFAQAIREE